MLIFTAFNDLFEYPFEQLHEQLVLIELGLAPANPSSLVERVFVFFKKYG